MSEVFNGRVQLRLRSEDLLIFEQKCAQMNRSHQVILREMIAAFNDGRLKITPTDEQREIYDY